MQLGLPLSPAPAPAEEVHFVRRRGARRYILRVLDDGSLRVTVPWWGSKREARAFVDAQQVWIAGQRGKRAARASARWGVGADVLVDGVAHRLATDDRGCVTLDGAVVAPAAAEERALKAAVQAWLRARAAATLPGELLALAARHDIAVTRVSIRNQASRWGSCSRRGTISLNWRLVQTPPFVRDYVLLHELCHLAEHNHSDAFWRLLDQLMPDWQPIKARLDEMVELYLNDV